MTRPLDAASSFGGIEDPFAAYESSAIAIWPVPFERTVSYGTGTAAGPAAILAASTQVELYDEELQSEPYRIGVATLPPFVPPAEDLGEAIEQIRQAARQHFTAGKVLLTLGGEHVLTIGPVRAARDVHGDIGVVQLDAHADLRDTYEGTPWSHACVMRRLHEDGVPALAVGIRALSTEEGELIRRQRLLTVWGYELDTLEPQALREHLDKLPEKVYLTFDIDYFDPSLVPATGTPEPGGGRWWPTLQLLREIFRTKQVVGMDVVELAPVAGHPVSDFLTARLVYKLISYWADSNRQRRP
ncbi:MAG: agmatinase [Thermoanaerobaculia bacterium]